MAKKKAKKKATKKRAKKSTKRSIGCKVVTVCGRRRKLCFKKTRKGIRITSNKAA